VVLAIVDSVSGIIWPPVVVAGEESAESWQRRFERIKQAGMNLRPTGVTSDGCQGLAQYLRKACSGSIISAVYGTCGAV